MKLTALEQAVTQHSGVFLCERIHDSATTKSVAFRHSVEPAIAVSVPSVGRLPEFYATFGSVLFYHDAVSGDAARLLAAPAQWRELHESFVPWLEPLEQDDIDDLLHGAGDDYLVIGEVPASGNYLLMPTAGAAAGHVIEFDHDGYEATDRAPDIVAYVEKLLVPDAALLTDFASHMRFIDGDRRAQWWIRELRDNRGRVVTTEA